MLFTINKPILSANSFESALKIAPKGSPFLLYEDGVYSVMKKAESAQKVRDAMQNHPIYALETDLKARGIEDVIEGIEIISYDDFVGLVEEHEVSPWL